MTLAGGPCAGSYMVRRAPLYLRAVATADGQKDVLDQLTDRPRNGERVYVYKRVGEQKGTVHFCRGAGRSGFSVIADYEYLPDVDAAALALDDWNRWQKWCEEQQA